MKMFALRTRPKPHEGPYHSDEQLRLSELEPEDDFTLLLCTDGLSNYCSPEFMHKTVFGKNLEKSVDKLIASANKQGGKDNITVALVAN